MTFFSEGFDFESDLVSVILKVTVWFDISVDEVALRFAGDTFWTIETVCFDNDTTCFEVADGCFAVTTDCFGAKIGCLGITTGCLVVELGCFEDDTGGFDGTWIVKMVPLFFDLVTELESCGNFLTSLFSSSFERLRSSSYCWNLWDNVFLGFTFVFEDCFSVALDTVAFDTDLSNYGSDTARVFTGKTWIIFTPDESLYLNLTFDKNISLYSDVKI